MVVICWSPDLCRGSFSETWNETPFTVETSSLQCLLYVQNYQYSTMTAKKSPQQTFYCHIPHRFTYKTYYYKLMYLHFSLLFSFNTVVEILMSFTFIHSHTDIDTIMTLNEKRCEIWWNNKFFSSNCYIRVVLNAYLCTSNFPLITVFVTHYIHIWCKFISYFIFRYDFCE